MPALVPPQPEPRNPHLVPHRKNVAEWLMWIAMWLLHPACWMQRSKGGRG